MEWTLRGDTPAYRQIVEQVQRQVATGQRRAGEPLPTVRELARQLRLNPGTVARAYAELERRGCIITRRGGGTFIADTPDVGPWLAQRQSRLSRLVEDTVIEALSLGYHPDAVRRAVEEELARWQQKPEKETAGLRFVGSHDLAVEVLASQLRHAYPSLPVSVRYAGSVGGLIALWQGDANVAGCHLLDETTGEYNTPLARRLLAGRPAVLVTLVERWQGLMLPHGNPKGIATLSDLARPDVTFVNRQVGSGTRLWLDQRLRALGLAPAQVRGYDRQAESHLAVAATVASGQADVGLGIQAAAQALGLDFVPLALERYDLALLQDQMDGPPVQALLNTLAQDAFRRVVAGLGGYVTDHTGQQVVI